MNINTGIKSDYRDPNIVVNKEDKKSEVSSGVIKQGITLELCPIDKDIAIKSVKTQIAIHKVKTDTNNKLAGIHIVVYSEIFKSLLPKGFLDVIKQGKSGTPELWSKDQDFDSKIIDNLILAFKEKRIISIVSAEGAEFKRIQYKSELGEILHKKTLDITKSEIIDLAFQHNCSELDEKDQNNLEKLIIKYVDFIGVSQRNFLKILKKSSKTTNLSDNSPESRMIKNFLNEITEQMRINIEDCIAEGESKRIAHHEDPIGENTIVITTTSSGGAHRSIANVIDQSLTDREIPHVVLNESNLVEEDNLKKFVGISRNDVFNKISQQCSQMDYGKKLKQLDDYLNQYDPDNYMDELRKSVGNSKFIVSTSHHPENVRLVAEKSKRICFQVCDFGELPDKLESLARTISKFNLKGITFFTPSKHSKLNVTPSKYRKSNINEGLLPLAAPGKGQKDRKESSVEIKTNSTINDKYEKRLANYQKFTQIQRYPVHSAFLKEDEEFIIETKAQLGIRQDAKLWILTMGSQGVGGVLKNYITAIIEGKLLDIKQEGNNEKLDVAVLCGTNESLVSQLQVYCNQKIDEVCKGEEDLSSAIKLQELLVFTPLKKLELPQVAALGKSCSAFLSKPGGGTTAEALMGGLPMLIHREKKHHWEFGNIKTLIENGATEVTSVENFYQLAKNVTPVITPDLLGEEDAVDYAIHALWQLEMERPKESADKK
ncbi:MAG: hypothetical protein H0W50_02510 [Parachlamydiaceae bacterium]|nr:hypothetical protein [Parachlamydiaceae bacterium]